MNIEIFSLCDAATVDSGGKLNILGAFDTLWAAQLPLTYPQMAIALRMRFSQVEQGNHEVIVHFVDADGKHLLPPAKGVINAPFVNGQRTYSTNSVLNVQLLRIERYGEYAIDLIIDGRNMASIPFFVVQPPMRGNQP